MTLSVFTQSLADWLDSTGYKTSQNDGVLTLISWEDKTFLRQVLNEYTLTRAIRTGPEVFCMSSKRFDDIERFLVLELGNSIRYRLHYSPIEAPTDTKYLKPGWTIKPESVLVPMLKDSDGRLRGTYDIKNPEEVMPGWSVVDSPVSQTLLFDADGVNRARFSFNSAIQFSWVAEEELSTIQESFLHPYGQPLFPTGWIGPRGAEPEYVTKKWTKYKEKIATG